MSGALRLDGVSAGYGRVPVLHGVSLVIAADESVALIGANGAGKSTLVRAICGLLPLSAGSITLDGRSIGAMAPHQRVRAGIGVVLENRHLFGELSVRTNLEIARASGESRPGAQRYTVDDVLQLFPPVRVRYDAAVELLSGGEQQMVALGRAMLLQPDLLILDEPSTGLSPKVLHHIVEAIATLRQKGLTILLVEQNVALAAKIADRAYVMSLGRIVHEIGADQWEGIGQNEALLRAYLGS